ncbi:hypothetical protein FHG87_022796 [Trinorchestia longiramus]|nr:hypothetical protein FHG87_022796 [Trinorchestia longiramus]
MGLVMWCSLCIRVLITSHYVQNLGDRLPPTTLEPTYLSNFHLDTLDGLMNQKKFQAISRANFMEIQAGFLVDEFLYFLDQSLKFTTKSRISQVEAHIWVTSVNDVMLQILRCDATNSVATPVDVNADLVTTSDEVEDCDKDLYQNAVGSLLYCGN